MKQLLILSLLWGAAAQGTQNDSWMKEPRYTLTGGNELYSFCRAAERAARTTDDGRVAYKGSQEDAVDGSSCYAYVRGVVDSLPAADFSPSETVRLSQYVDVVTQYLRDNPAKRDQPAYPLVRIAVTQAFHK